MKKAVTIIMVLIMTLTLFTVRVLAAEETTEGGTAGVLDLFTRQTR